ncbi:MAG: pyridoxal-phosphate dependent enzyme, partial [Atopobiaceae bacterium]|nr:pyridoxal-phosphate dependent enzyme [Atopobiaceae bacterium]
MITVKGIQLVHRDADGGGYESAAPYGVRVAQTTQRFHESIPGYTPTPLVPLDALAEELGLRGFLIKDENHRFAEYGLNAFKGLGGSWCLAQILADRLGLDKSNLRLSDLTSDRAREQLGDITFATATDGNHGRGVA